MIKETLKFERITEEENGFVDVAISSPFYRAIFSVPIGEGMEDYYPEEDTQRRYGDLPLPYVGEIWDVIEEHLYEAAEKGEAEVTFIYPENWDEEVKAGRAYLPEYWAVIYDEQQGGYVVDIYPPQKKE